MVKKRVWAVFNWRLEAAAIGAVLSSLALKFDVCSLCSHDAPGCFGFRTCFITSLAVDSYRFVQAALRHCAQALLLCSKASSNRARRALGSTLSNKPSKMGPTSTMERFLDKQRQGSEGF